MIMVDNEPWMSGTGQGYCTVSMNTKVFFETINTFLKMTSFQGNILAFLKTQKTGMETSSKPF